MKFTSLCDQCAYEQSILLYKHQNNLYIYIYKTEAFEAPTIFHISTIFFLKKKIKIKLFENPINFSPRRSFFSPTKPDKPFSPTLLPQSHGKAHPPSKDASLLPSKTKIPQSKPTIPTKSMLFSSSHSLWNYCSVHNFETFLWWSKANLLQPTNLHKRRTTKSNTTREGLV